MSADPAEVFAEFLARQRRRSPAVTEEPDTEPGPAQVPTGARDWETPADPAAVFAALIDGQLGRGRTL